MSAEPGLLAAIEAADLHCAQERYVVTDAAEGRTYALQRLDSSPG
ncbi:hypothetical protein [Streptomyces rubiginosohelvolus]|uniref:Uncharacterized protein n=1 Tax=Streptomyces rubiginosohelvolus TaxID=67362 RepID=A0ABW6ET62_9ACTN